MTIPTLLDYPLQAAPLAEERLPLRGADPVPLLLALVKQGFALIRSSEAWRKGKAYGSADEPLKGGKVLTLSCPSDMDGRLKKCAWHARFSQHKPKDCGLDFEDFFFGLGSEQHTPNEAEYVPDVVEALKIDEIVPGRADIWRNSYHLGAPTSNRDFLELVVTLPLPPSPAPFSRAHEEVTVRQLSTSHRLQSHPGEPSQGRRSFIVVSVPVLHHDAPERKEFVRARYASVEGVWEGQVHGDLDSTQQRSIEWFMAVQSDTAGKVPLMLQEMAMPSKIWHDVPLFFEWLRNKKAKLGKQPLTAADQEASQTAKRDQASHNSSNVIPAGGSEFQESEVQSRAESGPHSAAGALAGGTAERNGGATAHRDRQQGSDQGYQTTPDEHHRSHQGLHTSGDAEQQNGVGAIHSDGTHFNGEQVAYPTSTDLQESSSGLKADNATAATTASTGPPFTPSYPLDAPELSDATATTSAVAPALTGRHAYLAGDSTEAEEQQDDQFLGGSYGDGTAPSLEEQLARQNLQSSTEIPTKRH